MSISITLPDDADELQVAAAMQFFSMLLERQQAFDSAQDGDPDAVESLRERVRLMTLREVVIKVDPPHAVAAVRINATPTPPVVSAEERTAVAQIASAVAAEQFDDVPDFPSPEQAFGSATPSVPVPPAPPAMITPEAAAIGVPTPPPVAPSGVQLDKHGLPWDKRIHSDGKEKMNADGSWRKRRGLNDAALVTRVEAELRAAMSAPAAPAAVPTPPPVLNVVPFVPPPAPNAPPQAEASTSVPPAPSGDAPSTFPALMVALGPHLQSKKVTQEHINSALAAHQMPPGLPVLAARPDLVAGVWAHIKQAAGL